MGLEALEASQGDRILDHLVSSFRIINLEPGADAEEIEDREPTPIAGDPSGRKRVVRSCTVISEYLRARGTYEKPTPVFELRRHRR